MCTIFGLIDYKNYFTARQREKILKVLSRECEVRGVDATGFAYNNSGRLSIFKKPLAAHKIWLHLPRESNVIMGHTRMATQGDSRDNFNNHPFYGKCGNVNFALAHNGVLHNDIQLRIEKKLPQTQIKTDSYIAVQLLEQNDTLDFNSISKMAELVEGSFVFTILDEQNNMYFVKGDNPLALYHFEQQGFYVYAITETILNKALSQLGLLRICHTAISNDCGDIIKINSDGEVTASKFDTSHLINWDYSYFMLRGRYFWEDDNDSEPAEIAQLKQFANRVGIDPEYIELLLDYGYLPDEIEELIYIPGAINSAISEIIGEYDYCEEM